MTPSNESKPSGTQQDLASKEGYLTVTENSIKEALIEARGDIFIASQLLRVTAIRLDRAIQVSPLLQHCIATVKEHGKSGVSVETIHAAVERRLSLYRVAGLDALHDLATMPIDVNSAQNQVKLAAAARLAGAVESVGGSGIEDTLRELNQKYQQEAPRLRIVRERTTIETMPPERVIEQDG